MIRYVNKLPKWWNGIHVRLKIACLTACGFKSHLRHNKKPPFRWFLFRLLILKTNKLNQIKIKKIKKMKYLFFLFFLLKSSSLENFSTIIISLKPKNTKGKSIDKQIKDNKESIFRKLIISFPKILE